MCACVELNERGCANKCLHMFKLIFNRSLQLVQNQQILRLFFGSNFSSHENIAFEAKMHNYFPVIIQNLFIRLNIHHNADFYVEKSKHFLTIITVILHDYNTYEIFYDIRILLRYYYYLLSSVRCNSTVASIISNNCQTKKGEHSIKVCAFATSDIMYVRNNNNINDNKYDNDDDDNDNIIININKIIIEMCKKSWVVPCFFLQ
ncbi:LOW QUALITY PROTEIN: hypothetical protein V1477_012901 [Vespula maculifrons]|uniref:Uncharacterized protein n=1 Tax=Vespula maculifrons TaxID=7453 RepID=A0ABD2BUD3_VESMC